MRRLNLILGILGALALCGCTLDEPLQLSTRCGDKDHPLSMVVYNNIVCTPDDLAGEHINDSCTQFLDAFKNNSCPLLSPLCIHENDDDDYVCSTSHCQLTHHEVDGQCEPNTVIHCGGHGVDCEERMPGWVNGSCLSDYTGGKCFATQCENGYELNVAEGKCEARVSCGDGEHIYNGDCETDSVNDCGRHDFSCAVRTSGWVEGTCQKGICVPSQCDVGYELENGACVAKMICEDNEHIYKGACEKNNVLNCGFHGNDCRQSDGWVDGDCVESRCFASACEEGYELNAETGACRVRPCDEETEHKYGKICEKNSVEHCGQHDFNCLGRVPGWFDGSCVNGRCEASACTQGYRFDTGAKACVALINCEENMHVSGEDCAPDSLTACGSDNNDCTKRAGWAEGSCVAADCVATACVDGYEVKDGQCVSAIKTCAHCASNEVCVDGRCVVTGCMQDCNTYGKATSGVCSIEGKCIATSCRPYYHLYNGTCELNQPGHCGGHEVLCDSRQHEVCNTENGTCDCESGYERYDGICQVEGYSPLCDENNYTTVTYEGEEIRAWCIKNLHDWSQIRTGYPEDNEDNAFILMNDLYDVGKTGGNKEFTGFLFGNNHSINGSISMYGDASLLGELRYALVRDLIVNINVSGYESKNGNVGAIAEEAISSKFINIRMKGNVSGDGNGTVGGLVGTGDTVVFESCSVVGNITSSRSYEGDGPGKAGGLMGSSSQSLVINNCSVHGTISGSLTGGLAGLAGWGITVDNSSFIGNVVSSGAAGGIVAESSYGDYISHSYVKGNIEGGAKVGGIIGNTHYIDLALNYFDGTVKGDSHVGGIIGYDDGSGYITQCAVFGTVSGKSSSSVYIGGLYGSGVGGVSNSFSAADVLNGSSGALIGSLRNDYSCNTLNISNTYTLGKLLGITDAWTDINRSGCDASMINSNGFIGSWYKADSGCACSSHFCHNLDFNSYGSLEYDGEYLGNLLSTEDNPRLWKYAQCEITTGPANGVKTTYSLWIPAFLPKIDFCSN